MSQQNGTTPSVGRMVHYVSAGSKDGTYPSVCRAATVTEIRDDEDGTVSLIVFNPTGIHFVEAQYSENNDPMTWHWCERVP